MTGNEIVEFLDDMKREAEAINKDVISICLNTEGTISLTEAWELTARDIKIISSIIKERNEKAKKTQR